MKLDAHQHFWNYDDNASDYVWMTDQLAALRHNFLPEHLAKLLDATGFAGSIAVQARERTEETDYLLDLAKQHSFVKGIVGWVDLCATDVEQTLQAYQDEPLVKGFRMLIHDRSDADFANSEAHARGVGLLTNYGWSYDLLLRTIHLPAAIKLVDRHPNQAFVVDHIAKPQADGSDWVAWQSGIREIARRPNVFCKLSGLVTEAPWSEWATANYPRYLDEVLECFTATRCMIGSDWPVCTCAADYKSTMGVVQQWAQALSDSEKNAVFGESCAHFYKVA
ncbi:MAG: L-fuconolactonase [Granulosicoccus sp.]|jgi:L-fuconolactonase